MEWLLGPRRFYREQGDPKRKFQRHGVNPSIIQSKSSQIPALLLSVSDRHRVTTKSLDFVPHDHRGCNEGEFTSALETGAGK